MIVTKLQRSGETIGSEQLFGFKSAEGQWIISPVFQDVDHEFDSEGYCRANQNGKWGFINLLGDWVIEPEFDKAAAFNQYGMARVVINRKWNIIDRSGKILVSQSLHHFHGRLICNFELGNKWYSIDCTGTEIQFPTFFEVFSSVSVNDDDYIEGKSDHAFDRSSKAFYNGKVGVINFESEWVFNPLFEDIAFDDAHDNFAKAKIDGKWGVIGRNSQWIIPPSFDDIKGIDYSDSAYELLNLLGTADSEGFIFTQGISAGQIMAELDEKWGIINFRAEWIVRPAFDDLKKLWERRKLIKRCCDD